jgi:hypothetical protein
VIDDFLFIDRQDYFVTLDPEAQGIINSQDNFADTQNQYQTYQQNQYIFNNIA